MSDEKRTIAEAGAELLALEQFLAGQAPGSQFSYDAITEQTQVPMTQANKNRLRQAAKRAGHPDVTFMRGYGLVLASPETCVDILCERTGRIERGVRRINKIATSMLDKFGDAMTPMDKGQVAYLKAGTKAILSSVRQAREVASLRAENATASTIPLPLGLPAAK